MTALTGKIEMTARQARMLAEDVKDLPDDELVQLFQIPEWKGTVEMRVAATEEGDFLFRDGSTGY